MKRTLSGLAFCAVLVVSVGSAVAQQDNWNGTIDNFWITAGNWSSGLPGLSNDVEIYTGGSDLVFMDANSAVNSLAIGGPTGSSELEVDWPGNLVVVNGLQVGQYGYMNLGGGSLLVGGNITNFGSIFYSIGAFSVQGVMNNAGQLDFYGGFTNIPTFGSLTNSGVMDVDWQAVQINGDATNSGTITTGFFGSQGNGLIIGGNLTNNGIVGLYGSFDSLTVGGNFINNGTFQVNGLFENNVSISGNVINNPGATFAVAGTGTVATVSTLSNGGYVSVGAGATLNLVNQPGGITDAVAGSTFELYGTFIDNLGTTNGFANLNSVEGTVDLYGQVFGIFPSSGTLTIANGGQFTANSGTALAISGNVNNAGLLQTGPNGGDGIGGNVLTIGGTLTNQYSGHFYLNGTGPGDTAFLGGLVNSGFADVENGSTLQINGNVTNSGRLFTTFYGGGQSTLNVTGNLTNAGLVQLNGSGDAANIGGVLNNSGSFGLTGTGIGETANVGTLNNSGTVFVGSGSTLNLTNQPGGITDVVAGSTFALAGTFNAGSNSGFYQLTSVEGTLILENGQTTITAPLGGTFTVSSTGYVEVVSGTNFNINGNLTVNSGGIFSVNDPFPTTVNITGMLTNLGGTVNVVGPTAFLNVGGIGNGGMLALPEGSTVNLANSFYQLASGTLGEAIGASGFAIISVNGGLVMLDGTLDVLLDPGYAPAVGSTYKFFLFAPSALSGTFTSIQNDIFNGGTEKWVVVYNDVGGYVELLAANNSTVPEPSSLLLLGTGLLALMGAVKSKGSNGPKC